MVKEETKTEKVFTLRIDADLLEEITKIADSNLRSTAKEIEFILREELKRRAEHKKKAGEYLDLIISGNATPEQIKEIQRFFNVI